MHQRLGIAGMIFFVGMALSTGYLYQSFFWRRDISQTTIENDFFTIGLCRGVGCFSILAAQKESFATQDKYADGEPLADPARHGSMGGSYFSVHLFGALVGCVCGSICSDHLVLQTCLLEALGRISDLACRPDQCHIQK